MERLPTHVILCGPTNSGKTTLAKELVRLTGAVHIGGDEVAQELQREGKDASLAVVMSEVTRRIRDVVSRGGNVVNDGSYLNFEQRQWAREITHDLPVKTVGIYVYIAEEERIRRWRKTRKDRDRKSVPPERYDEHVNSFVPPSPDEPHTIFRSGVDNVPEWLRDQAVLLD